MRNIKKRSFLICAFMSVILSISSFAIPVLAESNIEAEIPDVLRSIPGYHKCIGSEVNIRTGPGTNYAIIGTLKYGTKVYVHAVDKGWAKICIADVYYYVSYDYLQEI